MTLAGRFVAAVVVVLAAGVASVSLEPLGALRGPMLLIVSLPVMARALAAVGWVPVAARPFIALRRGVPAVLGTYAASLLLSGFLTLDVAAVVAVPVGLAVARRNRENGRIQVAAAVVGANVGSLAFPFSNLTNLILVAGTGLGFDAYVALAWLPQLAAAFGAGMVLVARSRTLAGWASEDVLDEGAPFGDATGGISLDVLPTDITAGDAERTLGPIGILAGMLAVAGAVLTVVVGFAGGDVANVLMVASAVITALALLDGRLTMTHVMTAVPVSAVLVILAAAILREPIASLASYLPLPASAGDPRALLTIALVGGVLAATVNNLPAAAFGAIWLHAASGPFIIAYLLGTNVLALLTPHGSVATMLGRSLAHRGGVKGSPRGYVWLGWRYALGGTVPALLVLMAQR